MKLSDRLKAKRAAKLAALEAMNNAAVTGDTVRGFTDDENVAWKAIKAEIVALDAEIASAVDREETLRSGTPAAPMVVVDRDGGRHTVLRAADRMAERHMAGHRELLGEASFGAAIRGLVSGQWDGRTGLQRALGESTLPGGGYAVPAPLAAQWLDLMRARSVMIAAGTGTLPMDSLTLRVAGLATDPVPTSRKENTAVAVSDPTFRAVDFKAKSYGVIVTSSLELLADAPGAAAMVEASIIGAMALALDQACLNGDGLATGNLDNVLGLLNVAGINVVPDTLPGNYDFAIDGIAAVRANNMEPNAFIASPAATAGLQKLKTGIVSDMTTLVPPAAFTALTRLDTTSMPAATAVLGEFARAAIGMRESMTLEATRVSDTAMSKAQVQIRALMRFDFHPLYDKAFSKMTGVVPASARRAA